MKILTYSLILNGKYIVCDEASEAIFYAKEEIKKGVSSVFIEVREMTEEEFASIKVIE